MKLQENLTEKRKQTSASEKCDQLHPKETEYIHSFFHISMHLILPLSFLNHGKQVIKDEQKFHFKVSFRQHPLNLIYFSNCDLI